MEASPQNLNPYKEISEFAARQVSESRQMFERFYKMTFSAIAIVAAVIITGFYWSVGKEYRDIEAKVQATVQKKTDEQIALLQNEVRARIESEFKADNLRRLIKDVAVEQTRTGLQDVIARVVTERVEARVKAEEPQIQNAVTEETKRAVAGLSPTVSKEVEKQATLAEQRIQARIGHWEELIRAGNLSILARNGLGTAYDDLMKLAVTSANPDIRAIAATTQNQTWLEMNQPFYTTRTFKIKQSKEQLLAHLGNSEVLARKAAIDELVGMQEKAIVPKLLDMAEHDPYIVVRQAAFHGLQQLTGE